MCAQYVPIAVRTVSMTTAAHPAVMTPPAHAPVALGGADGDGGSGLTHESHDDDTHAEGMGEAPPGLTEKLEGRGRVINTTDPTKPSRTANCIIFLTRIKRYRRTGSVSAGGTGRTREHRRHGAEFGFHAAIRTKSLTSLYI